MSVKKIEVYVERGAKRSFAGALHWPGWCRGGSDEAAALQNLLDYGSRYAKVLATTDLRFHAPANLDVLVVAERLDGSASTDFGVADAAPAYDDEAPGEAELRQLETVLKACWRALEHALKVVEGKELRKGPRGGGRDRDKLIDHIIGADEAYIRQLGWRVEKGQAEGERRLTELREIALKALAAASNGELPRRGPRGGERWTPRYFVRRIAWHTLDHAWELEDRVV
jgi:hypothetical protein